MNTLTRRRANPLSDLRQWLESDLGIGLHGVDDPPLIRIEDFVDGQTYVLRAEMPGIDPDNDVDIIVDDGVLTIQAQRSEEKKDRDHREFRYGSFSRSVPLPRGSKVDDIRAEYRDGVLELRMPVDEPTPAPHRITVTRRAE